MTNPLQGLIDVVNREVSERYAGTDYADCYVAFLDILGMKELVKRPYADLRRIFNAAESGIELYARIQVPGAKRFIGQDHLKVTIMSDALVLSIDSGVDHAFSKLIGVSSYLIKMILTALETPVFIRGGIARGSIFHAGDTIFGPGLVQAYTLENELAGSMRCIVSPDLGDDYAFQKYLNTRGCALEQDPEDGMYFINFATPDNTEPLRAAARNISISDAAPKIKEKYAWLGRYLDRRAGA